nr:lipid A biosynthesis lauroyl acyltransferase [Caballeronia sp. LZ003]
MFTTEWYLPMKADSLPHPREQIPENPGFTPVALLLRALSMLPYRWVARIGSILGALLYEIPSRRKHIVLVNLRLCFPGNSEAHYQELAKKHFRHVIRSYLERGIQWYGSAKSIRSIVQIDSEIDLDDKNAPPTIFMGFHFVAIEVGCLVHSTTSPVAALYTRMSNKRLCSLAKRQRGRFGAELIERSTSARKVVALLRSGTPVMLAADMDHGIDNSVFVPFFGVPACTLTAVSRLAKLGHARVVPFVTEVLPDYRGYRLKVFKPLIDFPSASDTVDATRMNAFLEEQIRLMPEQYYWVHRRFKHRPDGLPSVY